MSSDKQRQQQNQEATKLCVQRYGAGEIHTGDTHEKTVATALENAKQAYLAKCREVKVSGGHFLDREFPKQNHWKDFAEVNWMYKPFEPCVIKDKVDPSHIQQGECGDSYFLSALCLLAQADPQILQRLVVSTEINKEGVYGLLLCVDGEWDLVVVDDYFPIAHAGHLKCAQAPDNQVYVALLEKAWAKLHGGYDNIVGTTIVEALQELSGAPIDKLEFKKYDPEWDPDQTWESLKYYTQRGYLIGALSKPPKAESKFVTEMGIVREHAYSCTAAVEFDGKRLVRLQNPFGVGNWKGEWGSESGFWTDKAKQALKYDPSDGSFFMKWDDVLTYFNDFSVCKLRPDYTYIPMVTKFDRNWFNAHDMYLVATSVPTTGYISLVQEDQRSKPEGYEYTDMGCVVVKTDDLENFDKWEFVSVIWPEVIRSSCCEVQFDDPNKDYLILPFHINKHRVSEKLVVSLYTANPVAVKRMAFNHNYLNPALWTALDQYKEKAEMRQFRKVVVRYFRLKISHTVWIWIENRDHWHAVTFETDAHKSRGMIFGRSSAKTEDDILSGQRQIINVMVASDNTKGGTYKGKFEGLVDKHDRIVHDPEVLEHDIFKPMPCATENDDD